MLLSACLYEHPGHKLSHVSDRNQNITVEVFTVCVLIIICRVLGDHYLQSIVCDVTVSILSVSLSSPAV